MAFPVYSQVWSPGPAGPRARPAGLSSSPHLSSAGSLCVPRGPPLKPSPLGPPVGAPTPLPPPVISELDVLSRDFYFSRSVVSGGDSIFDLQWQTQVIYNTRIPFPAKSAGWPARPGCRAVWVGFQLPSLPSAVSTALKFPERRQSGPGRQVRGVSPGSLSLSFLN